MAASTLLIDGEPTPYGAQLAWAGLATFPGLPATAVPVGKTPAGLPIGVQVIGKPFAEATLFRLAAQLERARPWIDRRPRVC